MKKQYHWAVLGVFAALGAVPAFGQSSVQVYGLIDTAVEHITNTASGGASLTPHAKPFRGPVPLANRVSRNGGPWRRSEGHLHVGERIRA
ncbi:hypothetical protein ACHMW6_24845 [Pseudoduganella sp. UC29_106]|uniref:hypothetical protein n=1 Tax=Pseudoduganella sp. UC29_106 TaxID=3374553 RepID=UPI003757DE7D